MAKTFYKYQERDIDSQVNWADIGLGMSDMITDQVAVRKAKKEAYDDEARAFNQYLDESPDGEDANLASWTSAYSSDMQKKMLDNQRAFKNGMISERDNVTFTQNVKNGTSTIFNLATEYQAEYKETMARMKSNDPSNKNQELEMFVKAQNESYDNYKTSKPIIDPKTGLVLMSMKRKDGTYETVSAANLSNRIKAKYDYFDSNATTTKIESELGDEMISTYDEAKSRLKTGLITEEQFKPLKAGFDNALKTRIDSYLTQETNVSSILTNDLLFDKWGDAIDYKFTYDKIEALSDPYKILLVVKGGGDGMPMPDFTTANGKRQIEAAKEYMMVQTIEKIDRKVSQQVIAAMGVPAPNPYFTGRADDKKKEEDAVDMWAKNMATYVFGNSQTAVDDAGNFIAGGFGGTGKNTFDKKGWYFTQTDKDGDKRQYKMDGSRESLESLTQQSGIPVYLQKLATERLVKYQQNRQPNRFSNKSTSTSINQEIPYDFSIFNKTEKK